MKLRNKKTGEIKEWQKVGAIDYGEMNEVYDSAEYNSLAELNEEWEDYKPIEPLINDEKVKKLLGEVVELELTVNELSKRFDEFKKHYVELCGEGKE